MVVIEFSGGGAYDTFDSGVKETIEKAEEVQIVGECYSSCTLFLRNPKTCVAPGAKLAFHAWRLASDRSIYREHTERVLKTYPQKVQDYIAANGGLDAHWIVLEGPDLTSIVKVCAAPHTATPERKRPDIVTGLVEAPTPWSKKDDNVGAVISRFPQPE